MPLWHLNVTPLIHASPMSYAIEGKRYLAIAAGSDVFYFALPVVDSQMNPSRMNQSKRSRRDDDP
jgi:hypothetical protein